MLIKVIMSEEWRMMLFSCFLLAIGTIPLRAQVIGNSKADSTVSTKQTKKPNDYAFPILKKIPLSNSVPVYLSVGGQLREYYQFYKNENFGKLPHAYVDNNGFIWHRVMLNFEMQVGNRVVLFTELKSGLTTSRAGGNRPRIDYNELDFHQLLLQITLWQRNDADLKINAGRQEYISGAQRLFTEREGPNNKAAFNAAKILLHKKNNLLTLLIAQPVYDRFYLFDDSAIKSQTVWGANLTHRLKENSGKWELYYYGYHNSNISLASMTGVDDRHTFGWFYLKNHKDWRLEAEPVFQIGKFNSRTILAYSFFGSVQKTFTAGKIKLEPAISLGDFSGNQKSNSARFSTYNSMFSRPAFGLMFPLAPINIISASPGIKILTNWNWKISADATFFWRHSHADGLYNPFVQQIYPVDPPNSAHSNYIGNKFTAGVDFSPNSYLSFGLLGGYFKAGRYLKQTGPGKDMTYLSVTFKLIF